MTSIAAFDLTDSKFEQLRKLSEVGRAFTYTTSFDEVARLTATRGADLLGANGTVVMLHDGDGLLQVRAAHGIDQERITRFRAPLTDEVIGRLQGLFGVADECFIAVPLVVGGAVTGLLAADLGRVSTESDEWLFSALADQAAIALENARLAGEVQPELESRLRASEGATDAKDRALSTLAHDIRSPLGAIDGYCTILEDGLYGPINEKQRGAIARVRMSGQHLLSLLDNVMDMARLSAGVMGVRDEVVALRDVAREAVDMLTPASYAKHQTLRLAGGAAVAARGDSARTRQVLVNLIGNAVKFTPADGTITVSVAAVHSEHDAWGEIRVTDSGPGVSADERDAIFQPYYRSAGTAAAPGIGLGLAISHALVAQMGGTLGVESEVGGGSSFTIRLSNATRLA
ncbi:MAG TPA: ATP-binding protein [Gemmatimonadaceae bacterium]|jgi:signal transduction histidine kinase